MKIFLDTGNTDEIRAAMETHIIDGVTCNPAILSRQTQGYEAAIKTIVQLVGDRKVFAQVMANKASDMVEQAKRINSWGANMVIKLPANLEGIKACTTLSTKGVKTAVTLIYSAGQAVIAAQAGADYIAPFIGRACDIAQDGIAMVASIVTLYQKQGFKTRLLAASLRTPADVIKVLSIGQMDITLPYATLLALIDSSASNVTLNAFISSWNNTGLPGL